jgi:hypothetical protein
VVDSSNYKCDGKVIKLDGCDCKEVVKSDSMVILKKNLGLRKMNISRGRKIQLGDDT